MALPRKPVMFDISRYLPDKEFDIIWRYPRDPPIGRPKTQFFEWLKLECQCFLITIDI